MRIIGYIFYKLILIDDDAISKYFKILKLRIRIRIYLKAAPVI